MAKDMERVFSSTLGALPPCYDKDGHRVGALLHSLSGETERQLAAVAASLGWIPYPDLRAYVVHLGCGNGFNGIAELTALLQKRLPRLYNRLHFTWLNHERTLYEQVERLAAAWPLDEANVPVANLYQLLTERRLETWYQPIYEMGTRKVWGYECLVRARDAQGEEISAAMLLESARQESLLLMFDRVCREMHLANAARDLPADAHILINFLPAAIHNPDVCLQSTFDTVRRAGLEPERIFFAVVETEAVKDRDSLIHILKRYRDAGFKVALEDLSSGYSSLLLLGDLDPDVIKMERELVAKAQHSPLHHDICAAIIGLGRSTGKKVLAEGIETREQFDLIHRLGIDLIQGFLFGEPGPAAVSA